MNAPRIVALVPMRHDSERVRGKNYRPMAGKRLYHHVVEALLASRHVAEVVIDTDSTLIMEDAACAFPSVRVLERPVELRGGHVAMNEVLLYDVSRVEGDFYLQTHSTNPLLETSTIDAAVEAFLHGWPQHDSLFSVTPLQTRLYWADGRPLNHDPDVLLRTQDLPPVYEENSNLYIFSRRGLQSRRSRIGARPLLFEIDRAEAWDIDEELDFMIAECLLEKRAGVEKR